MKEKQKGITLIALIITIIILLILTVVAIRAVSGEGMIAHAKSAKEKTDKAQAEEKIKLGLEEWKIVGSTTDITLKDFIENRFGEENVMEGENDTYIVIEGEYEAVIDKDGNLIEIEKVGPKPVISKIKVVENSDGTGEALAEKSVEDENKKLYITFMHRMSDGRETTVSPEIPFEVSSNGSYPFTLTGPNGEKKIINVTVNQYDQGPSVEFTSTPISETKFNLEAQVINEYLLIEKYEFFVNEKLKETIETSEKIVNCEITVENMDYYECYVIVTDYLGNSTKKSLTARTKMHTWEVYDVKSTQKYQEELGSLVDSITKVNMDNNIYPVEYTFNTSTGTWSKKGEYFRTTWRNLNRNLTYELSSYASGKKIRVKVVRTYWNEYQTVYYGDIELYEVTKKSVTEYSKGPNKKPDVISKNYSAHGNDVREGNLWYLYKGIE